MFIAYVGKLIFKPIYGRQNDIALLRSFGSQTSLRLYKHPAATRLRTCALPYGRATAPDTEFSQRFTEKNSVVLCAISVPLW